MKKSFRFVSCHIVFCWIKQVCSLWHWVNAAVLSATFSVEAFFLIGGVQVFYYRVPVTENFGSLRSSEVLLSSRTRQAPVCCRSVLRLTVRTVLFQSRNAPFIHFPLRKKKEKNLSKGQIWNFLQRQWRQTWCTLEILSLLHWLTPLLTLTMHSTARLRACCTSSRGGTMEMLGMERVTLARRMACWLLLLPRLGASPSAEWRCKFKGLTSFAQGKDRRHTYAHQLLATKNNRVS